MAKDNSNCVTSENTEKHFNEVESVVIEAEASFIENNNSQ